MIHLLRFKYALLMAMLPGLSEHLPVEPAVTEEPAAFDKAA